jgi:RNA polymerase sigma-70 factor, ECF subfamily
MNAGFSDIRFTIGSSSHCRPALPSQEGGGELPLLLKVVIATLPRALAGCMVWGRETWAAACSSHIPETEMRTSTELAALDAADIRASLGDDSQAYARLVRRYQGPVSAYMQRFTRHPAQWEELVHNVFVDAYFGLHGYSGRAPLLHWLKRIGTRVGYRYWKDCRRQRERSMPVHVDLPAIMPDEAAACDAADFVEYLLGQLSPRDRLVITLIHLESCSYEEAGRLTGWGTTMVKVQTHRARKRLARICKEKGIEL